MIKHAILAKFDAGSLSKMTLKKCGAVEPLWSRIESVDPHASMAQISKPKVKINDLACNCGQISCRKPLKNEFDNAPVGFQSLLSNFSSVNSVSLSQFWDTDRDKKCTPRAGPVGPMFIKNIKIS